MLNRLIFILFFSLISLEMYSQTYSGPESVEYDYANSRWLIANTQSHQVLARDMSGVLTIFTTLTGSGPYGIEIVGDTLYCCNGGSIKGFLLSNATQVFNVNVGASFLNGITHDDAGNLIATDFSAKAIYKININSQMVTPIATSMATTPNGIIFDAANNRCVFVNWSSNAPVKAIDLATNVITTLATSTLGNCDGIARDGQGNYYVSVWSGQKVVKFDSSFSAAPVTVLTGLNNPADIFYNTQTDTLGIPNAGNNTVLYYGFGTTGIEENEKKFNLYPTICSRYLTFVSTNKIESYKIIDINGRLILEGEVDPGFVQRLDVESIRQGVYYVIVKAGGSSFTRKFVRSAD